MGKPHFSLSGDSLFRIGVMPRSGKAPEG